MVDVIADERLVERVRAELGREIVGAPYDDRGGLGRGRAEPDALVVPSVTSVRSAVHVGTDETASADVIQIPVAVDPVVTPATPKSATPSASTARCPEHHAAVRRWQMKRPGLIIRLDRSAQCGERNLRDWSVNHN